ncbi:hypothetical protein EF908_31900 [Streptomyces sp. WAC04770]|nr:hypothetical protein [Streptomyces sp. WAC04770]RST19536.1 hypothetical protein EF908_31900 [Streptomyces sp. WAC04770]
MTISLEAGSPAHRLHLRHLAIYLRHSRQILAVWDLYSSRHSAPVSGQPHDEDSYGRRQQKRDRDTLSAFSRIYYHADELVDAADQQLAQLTEADRAHRYAWRVRELDDAAERLHAVRVVPNQDRATPGTKAYEEALAESYADAWPYLNQWTSHGQALFAINALAERSTATSPTTVIAQPAPTTAAAVRRCRP